MLDQVGCTREGELHTPSEQIRHGGGGSSIGNMGHRDPGTVGERHHRDMGRTADPAGSIVQLTRILLGVVDQFLKRLGRDIRVNNEHVVHIRDAAHRLEALQRIIWQLRIKGWIDREACRYGPSPGYDRPQAHGRQSPRQPTRPRQAGFNDDRKFESCLKPLSEKAGQNVG